MRIARTLQLKLFLSCKQKGKKGGKYTKGGKIGQFLSPGSDKLSFLWLFFIKCLFTCAQKLFFSRGSTVIIKLTNREDEGGERELISSENVRMSIRDKQEGNKNRRRRENVSSCHIFRRPTHAAESTPESTESKGARLHSPCFFLLLPNLKVVVKMLLQTLNDYLFGISEIDLFFKSLSYYALTD